MRARIGRQPAAAGETSDAPAAEDWPPEALLALHDRYDVSRLDVEVRRPVVGRLLTRVRRAMLRPVGELAGRQTEVNALVARTLSELANRVATLQSAEETRRSQEQTVQTLRRRIAALEAELGELRAQLPDRRDSG